ncbi:hypothetical protein OB03_12815 [Brevundimonas sp. GN22]
MNLYTKASGIWAVDLRSLGKGRVTLGTRDKAEARRRIPRAVAGEKFADETQPIGRPVASAVKVDTTMAQLFRRCMNDPDVWMLTRSQATLRSNDKILCATVITLPDGDKVTFGELAVADVTAAVLEKLAKALQAKKYAQSSVKRKLDMISKSLSKAVDWEIISTKPKVPSISIKDNARKRVLMDHEEKAVFAAIAARHAAHPTADWVRFGHAIRFLLDTGCRKAELENVRSEWIHEIDLGTRTVHRMNIPSWITKSEKDRTIPLTSAIVASLPDLIKTAAPAPAGKPRGLMLFPYTGSFLWYRWKLIVADLKEQGYDLSDMVLHSFRHTCLTRLSMRGMPIEKVADWAGHSDISITVKHYRHAEASSLDLGVDLLER